MRYEVNENNAVSIWEDGQEAPFVYQPHYPNGDSFSTREEAESWAQAKILEHEDINAPEAPNYPGEEPKKQFRLIRQEMQQHRQDGIAKLVSLGLTQEQAEAVAGNSI